MNTLKSFVCALSFATTAAVSLPAAEACCSTPDRAGGESTAPTAAARLPERSLYQFDASWQDQDGRQVRLADFAGTPVVVTMIFTHCAYACPRIIADLQALRAALPAEQRERVRFVLASFDSTRDTPERLHAWAASQELDANWTLLHGDAAAVRELSVLLEIPFVPQPDGSFGHGNRLVLLDAQGVPVTTVEGLGASAAPIVAAVSGLLNVP